MATPGLWGLRLSGRPARFKFTICSRSAGENQRACPTRHTLRDVGPSNGCAASRQEFDRHPPRSACVAVGESLNHGRALPEQRPATSLRDRRRPNRRLSSANVRGRGRGTITCLKQSTQCCPPGFSRRATASKDLVAERLFIAEHRAHTSAASAGQINSGRQAGVDEVRSARARDRRRDPSSRRSKP